MTKPAETLIDRMEVLGDSIGEGGTRYSRFEKAIKYTKEQYESDLSLVEGVQADEVIVEPIELSN